MIPIVNGFFTLLLIILFLGIWAWAWSGRNKDAFDKMSRLPLEGDSSESEVSDVK